jgi:hypothetical protein
MANEGSYSAAINFTHGGEHVALSSSGNISPSEVKGIAIDGQAETVDGTVPLSGLTAFGTVMILNRDETNYITVGPDGSSYPIKISAGRTSGPIEWNSAAMHIKAHTSACAYTIVAIGI